MSLHLPPSLLLILSYQLSLSCSSKGFYLCVLLCLCSPQHAFISLFFPITQFICSWHKVSCGSTGAQSATGKHIPFPGLYRSVTSDWTESSTNVLSSMLLCPVLKWPTCFRDINVFYFPLCILFPLWNRSHCGTKIEKDALWKIKNTQK